MQFDCQHFLNEIDRRCQNQHQITSLLFPEISVYILHTASCSKCTQIQEQNEKVEQQSKSDIVCTSLQLTVSTINTSYSDFRIGYSDLSLLETYQYVLSQDLWLPLEPCLVSSSCRSSTVLSWFSFTMFT